MSSTASAPALDVTELNFDTCERLRHLDWLLTRLGIADGSRVLDAGGYPCYMARAFPHRKVVTADMYPSGHAPYVRASGAALPFPDSTFDVTIACDVLEHVPQVHREAFLTELVRVSSRAVIVAGPYTTPGAARAEVAVRSLLPESSPAQMWLAEHAECGLPSLGDSMGIFRTAGALDVKALPVGSLTEWMLFFAGQAAGDRHHEVASAMKTFIERYNRLYAAPGISCGAPAYRHAIVAALDERTLSELERIAAGTEARFEAGTDAGDQFDREQVEAYVDSLGALLHTVMLDRGAGDPGAAGDAVDSITEEYIQRLETMLAHRGMEPPPRSEGAGADNGDSPGKFLHRLRAAWRALRG